MLPCNEFEQELGSAQHNHSMHAYTAIVLMMHHQLAGPIIPAMIQGLPCPKSAFSMVPPLQLDDMAAQSLNGTNPGAASNAFQKLLSMLA